MFTSRTSTRTLLGRCAQRTEFRRSLTASSGLRSRVAHDSGQRKPRNNPGWSRPKVLAVAIGAGALGWGLASLNEIKGTGNSTWGRSVAPHYATLPEMEKVKYLHVLMPQADLQNRRSSESRTRLE